MDKRYDGDSEGEGEGFSHKFGERDTQRMIENAYILDEMKSQITHVMIRALGDLPMACETCGELCDEHCVKLRDAFFKRASVLCTRVMTGLDLYMRERNFGISEPVEVINGIYRAWTELACLIELVEPDNDEDSEEASVSSEDDVEG